MHRLYALAFGVITHLLFLVSITLMFFSILHGLQLGSPQMSAPWSIAIDMLLALQFPIIHSLFLNRNGAPLLERFAPAQISKKMKTTAFSLVASLQLIVTFFLWQPFGSIIFEASGWLWYLHCGAYVLSWLYLGAAIFEAGAGLQTGFIGWFSVWTNQPTKFPALPTRGLHGFIRHPIYLAFALLLLTAPRITHDVLLLWLVWVPYCFIGPRFKEQRLAMYNKDIYQAYQQRVPYMLPFLK
ncbi:MAG: hypothetical protein KDD62_03810 [Bdellovibrionales bacterium]|nr:hypothetical protein [Bdellovibrionales bacterium]